VGNHGGGPSELDLIRINELIADRARDIEIVHSTPQNYFADLAGRNKVLPRYSQDINPWAVGCYSTMIRVKRYHRMLENEFYSAEKMASAAFFMGLIDYPERELQETLEDLLLAEFHDILPGSCVETAEKATLNLLGHGLEIAARIKLAYFLPPQKANPLPRKDISRYSSTTPILIRLWMSLNVSLICLMRIFRVIGHMSTYVVMAVP